MEVLPLHLEAGSDVRQSLEALACERGTSGYVLSVVGNLSAAAFQCPGKAAPTRLRGELEIITLSGTISPDGVHLHLSFSDGDCRVWGGHLEPGTLVLRGADLLLGFLEPAVDANGASRVRPHVTSAGPIDAMGASPAKAARVGAARAEISGEVRLDIAVLPGCPWSARALRMLRSLSIPHRLISADSEALRAEIAERSGSPSLPQLFLDGEPIGGYEALAERHGRGELEELR